MLIPLIWTNKNNYIQTHLSLHLKKEKIMIKFFRKIRQKLLSENKFSKYLLYAIVEIVLVVIGILIALQINNWNAEQKMGKEEIGILNNLLDGLSSAKEQSDIEISNENQLKE